jgi:hypothetical protein
MFTTAKKFRNFVTDVTSGIGTTDDPGNRFSLSTSPENYTSGEIISAYTSSGQMQRIIDSVPISATNFIYYSSANNEIVSITEQEEQAFNLLKLRHNFQIASISARLFRESYLLIVTEQEDLSLPLEPNETIFELMPLDCDQLGFNVVNNYDREYKLKILEPRTNISNRVYDSPVHASRVLMFAGKFYPQKVKACYGGYNGSVIGGILTSYGSYRHSLNLSVSLLSRMATFVLRLAKLQDYVRTGNTGGLIARLSMIKRFIGSVGGFVIDAESESLEWLQIRLTGISEIVNLHAKQFASEVELTHDQLWNEGSNNTTSELEATNWNERVDNFLTLHWQENFNRIHNHICANLQIPYNPVLIKLPATMVNQRETETEGNSIKAL